MEKEKLLAVLRLQKTKSVGNILAKKLIVATGDVAQIFREKKSSLQKINGIGTNALKQLFDKESQEIAEKELEYILQNNIATSYFLDEDYPKNLSHCIDGPILFFKEGNIDFINDRIISVVGTRNMTSYGRSFCEKLIAELTEYNPIIISGFAYGVDICAHKAAIKNHLQTIAVLGHGFDQIYPKTHKKYMRQVLENGGFITEFFHDENPLREHFLKRNRIVAGLSQATIIIESAEKGGALVTADIANSYNRDVFAVAGRTTDVYSKGCNHLIKSNQASLLTTANDIARMLNWDLPSISKPKQVTLFIELEEDEQKVVDYLFKSGKQTLDDIALACVIPVYKLAPMLVQLELKGVLKPLPGKMFELV
ncbi:MAG: DNA-protecting protein DprA [Flavobacteriaceae bacterium]|nr:DNA-protecting protein DprA [Flavobacteriaceae bacterium]